MSFWPLPAIQTLPLRSVMPWLLSGHSYPHRARPVLHEVAGLIRDEHRRCDPHARLDPRRAHLISPRPEHRLPSAT